MSHPTYDVIVLGSGVVGSSAAYHLAKQGKKTLLLEQFPIQHSRGSSHGHSRITRLAYEQDYYTEMMVDAFQYIDELEKEVGTQIVINCGTLSVGTEDGKFLQGLQTSFERVGEKYERMNHQELKKRYPMMKYPDDFGAILDCKGGVVKADCYLRAVQTIFVQKGGIIRDSEPVLEIIPGPEVTIKTTKGVYSAGRLVIAAGSWTNRVIRPLGLNLPLQPLRVTVMYWKERVAGSHSPDVFPCFIDHGGSSPYDIWGLPSLEYPGYVKVVLHSGPEILPETRDEPEGKWVSERVAAYIREHLPGIEPSPAIIEPCIYTNTPDEDFIIDHHPLHKNIIIAAGFSGHGFKLAPAVGRAISQLATGTSPKYNMTPFKIDRFQCKHDAFQNRQIPV